MSYDSSIDSTRDHTSAAAAAAASLPTKRTHKMMDNKTTNNDESVCTTLLLASGMERLKAAQIELINAQNNMESVRQQIRNSGDVEPDSLLCLCDKEDNYILSYIMNYLDVDDLGRCELVCSTLNKQAKKIIDKLDGVQITNYTGKEPVPKDVTFVGLHPSVIEISKEAFKDCSKLRNVVLNEGLLTIRNDAFRNCTSLRSIKFPSTLMEIADSAFKGNSNLEEVVLNNGLQKIGDKVFESCTSLESIILPPNLIDLGYYVFAACASLTDVVFNENEERRKIGRLEVPLSIDEQYQLQNPAYDGRSSDSNLKEIVFHTGGLRSIEKGMFSDCKSLERIKLPSTIITIEESAFYECFRLREVVLNKGLWRIDCQAFFRCISLESITLPPAPAAEFYSIESCSFRYCTSLREVILTEGLKKINNETFYGQSSLEQIDSPINMSMEDGAFAGCRSLECLKFPYISARLEHIICAGHADIKTKIDEIRGAVGWQSNQLVVSAAETRMKSRFIEGPNWKSVEESLKKIVNLLAFYEFKEATVLFELALWKAKIDQEEEGTNPIERSACRTEVPRKVKDTILQFMFRGYGN